MKKLILAGLLSVGVACANEVKKDTEKCTSKTRMTFYKESSRFHSLFEGLFHVDDNSATAKLTSQQFEKMCNAFFAPYKDIFSL